MSLPILPNYLKAPVFRQSKEWQYRGFDCNLSDSMDSSVQTSLDVIRCLVPGVEGIIVSDKEGVLMVESTGGTPIFASYLDT